MDDVYLIQEEVNNFLVFMTNGTEQIKSDLSSRFVRNFVALLQYNLNETFERIGVSPDIFNISSVEQVEKTDQIFKLIEQFLHYKVNHLSDEENESEQEATIQTEETLINPNVSLLASPQIDTLSSSLDLDSSNFQSDILISNQSDVMLLEAFEELVEMLNDPFKAFCFESKITKLISKNAKGPHADILLGGVASQNVLVFFIKYQLLSNLFKKVSQYPGYDESAAKPFLESNSKINLLLINQSILNGSDNILELYKTGVLVDLSSQTFPTAASSPEDSQNIEIDEHLVRYAAYRLYRGQRLEYEFLDRADDEPFVGQNYIFGNRFFSNPSFYTRACDLDAEIANTLSEYIRDNPLVLNSHVFLRSCNRLSLHHVRNLSYIISTSVFPLEVAHRFTEIPFFLLRSLFYKFAKFNTVLIALDVTSVVKDLYILMKLFSFYAKYFNVPLRLFDQPFFVNLINLECAAASSRGLMLLNGRGTIGIVDGFYLVASYIFPRAAIALTCLSFFTFFLDIIRPLVDGLFRVLRFILSPFSALGRAATLFFNINTATVDDNGNDDTLNVRYNCPFGSAHIFIQFLLADRTKDLNVQDLKVLQELLDLFDKKKVELKDVMVYLNICNKLDIELLPGEIMALKLACFKESATPEDKREILNTEIALNVLFRVQPTIGLIEKAEAFIAQYKAVQLERMMQPLEVPNMPGSPDALRHSDEQLPILNPN